MAKIKQANVVLNFHRGDQRSAASVLQNLLRIDDGMPCTYFLQYGDDWSTLEIEDVVKQFSAHRNVVTSNSLPEIEISAQMIAADPNDSPFVGLHTRRDREFKSRFLNWNLCVYKYINELDHFQMIEPDCVILKDGWIRQIAEASENSSLPIFGHLKSGKIGGKLWPTHWAGCSFYNGRMLRQLPLKKYFHERYPNPWWPYRTLPDTETANNAFVGPVFSGYDVTYDYFLYALYWRERTGSNDPSDWPLKPQEECGPILCDFQSRLSGQEIVDKYYGRISLFHGAKDDLARKLACQKLAVRRALDCKETNANRVSPPLKIEELRNAFANERCIIIGNGPSLNKVDFELLKGQWTIGTNRIYLLGEKHDFEPTFYCCVNPNVIDQFGQDIQALRSVKFVRDHRRELVGDDGKTFFMTSEPRACFVEELQEQRWSEGWTVTYCAMQVAFYLGFSEVVLVGVDHYFTRKGTPNKLVEETASDPNHFDPNYFGPGVKWQYPDLERSERSYRLARATFGEAGRRIYDATVDGHLLVFQKVKLEDILKQPPRVPRVTLASSLKRWARQLKSLAKFKKMI